MKTFEYFFTRLATGELEVEDIGNCTIQACNDMGMIWYLMTQTTLGWTKIMEYGPATPDFDELPKSAFCTFERIEFDEKKLNKKINEFLNNPRRGITQAMEVDRYIAFEDCKSIVDYMRDESNF